LEIGEWRNRENCEERELDENSSGTEKRKRKPEERHGNYSLTVRNTEVALDIP
jgi:hypothetical protein